MTHANLRMTLGGAGEVEPGTLIRQQDPAVHPPTQVETPEEDPSLIPSRSQAWVQEQIKEAAVWARDPLIYPLADSS